MKHVSDIMTPSVEVANPDESLRSASERMRRMNVGALPVSQDGDLCGFITDRDIVIRGLAEGLDPDETPVREAMTEGVFTIFEDQSIAEAAHLMQQIQIRRIPVVDRKRRLVGIVSIRDIAAERQHDALSGRTFRQICADAA